MKSQKISSFIALLFMVLLFAGRASADEPQYPEIMFILDGSGSMWGKADEQTKIQTAKEVMNIIIPRLPEEVSFGLVAYGHRRKGDCQDVETLIKSKSTDREALLAAVESISPKGKTPIAASVNIVAEALKTNENETTIVLVSDGIETCHDAPCEEIQKLSDSGLKFVLHVVGFDVDEQALEQLQCFARAGNGQFFSAHDSDSLLAALESINQDVKEKVAQAKTSVVQKSSGLGKIQLDMPQGAQESLNGLQIIRSSDDKLLKQTEKVTEPHPLPAGEYRLVLLFANPNYRDPDEVSLGSFQVSGGETTMVSLGALDINIAEELTKSIDGVILIDEAHGEIFLKHHNSDNNYYMFKSRPLPEGRFTLQFIYMKNDEPATARTGIEIAPGQTTTVTMDSGIQVQEAPGVMAWSLTDPQNEETVLRIERSWDNQYPLWHSFPVNPGTYDLNVELEGMTEPLPVIQGLEIMPGQTSAVDTGL